LSAMGTRFAPGAAAALRPSAKAMRASALGCVRHHRIALAPSTCPPSRAVRTRRSPAAAASSSTDTAPSSTAAERLAGMATQLAADGADGGSRLKALVRRGLALPAFAADARTLDNRIVGCTTQVWLTAELSAAGLVTFQGTLYLL
jgi:hypothetical protein